MRRLLLIAAALTLAGCENTQATKSSPLPSYYQDQRTGICFAAVSSQSYSTYQVVSIATVPCDQVPAGMLRVTEPG